MTEPTTLASRYALFGEIASGGMATVYFGRLLASGGFTRTVAIKRLHPQFAKDPEFVAMFLDEARLAARIRHPNVVPTIDVVATDVDVFLVLEYVHGESLNLLHLGTRKEGSVIALPITVSIMAAVLHGLHAAHEAKNERGVPLGIVHRDVSPQNILVGVDGVPRILDFGVAKAADRMQSTQETTLKGKFAYMSPEQLNSEVIDRRSDIYAAGVVLWELLAGQRLFHGENEAAVVTKALNAKLEPPSKITPGIPAELDAITMRALARDRNDRFATARDMALALEGCGGLAMPSQIGSWVEKIAGPALLGRAQLLARIETSSSAHSTLDAKELVNKLKSMPPPKPSTPPGPPPPPISAIPPAPRVPSIPDLHPLLDGAPPGDPSPVHASSASRPSMGGGVKAVIAGGVLAILGAAGLSLFLGDAGQTLVPAAPPSAASSMTVAVAPPPPAATCAPGMVRIQGGKFFMGSEEPDAPKTESPAHQVILAGYCIDEVEVTTSAYRACSAKGECRRAGQANDWPDITEREHAALDPLCNIRMPEDRAKHPINCVTWENALSYCRAQRKRLPTEAEWEFAVGGTGGRKYPWGDAPPSAMVLNACGKECVEWGTRNHIDQHAMYLEDDGWAATAPVGSFPVGKARSGMQDAAGNVSEWVADFFGPYEKDPVENPTGPAMGDTHVVRGAAWNAQKLEGLRPSARFEDIPEKRSSTIGFRCVMPI